MANIAQVDSTQQIEDLIPLWRRPFAAWRLTNLSGHVAENVESKGNEPGMTTVLVRPNEDGTNPTFISYTDDEGTVQEAYRLVLVAPFYGGDNISLWVPTDYNGTDSIDAMEYTATPIDASLQDIEFNKCLQLMSTWFLKSCKSSLLKERTWSRISKNNRDKIRRAISRVPSLQYLASSASSQVT